MKTSLEDVSSVKKKLYVEVDAEEVRSRVDASFRELGKRAKIRGFRPGKIPRRILERYFGDQVLEDVKNALVKETLPKALKEAEAFPLGVPAVESETLKVGEGFKFSATMEVKPQFELKDYMGLEVEKENCRISQEDAESQLEEIRQNHGKLITVEEDRGIIENDHVIIEYEGFEGEKALEGSKSQNQLLRIGSGEFHPDFEKALIGRKKGERAEIGVNFEPDYYYSKLAGKSVTFKVGILEIKEMKLPDLDDEFVKNLGAGVDSLDELAEKVRESIAAGEEKRIERELKKRLLKKISESVEFEIPEILVQSELSYAVQNISQNLIRSGSSMEKAGFEDRKLREELRPSAEARVKELLVLGEVAGQNVLTVSETELSDGFEEMAQNAGHNPEEVRQYYESNNLMDVFKQGLLEEKTLNYLVEGAKVIEVEKDEIPSE